MHITSIGEMVQSKANADSFKNSNFFKLHMNSSESSQSGSSKRHSNIQLITILITPHCIRWSSHFANSLENGAGCQEFVTIGIPLTKHIFFFLKCCCSCVYRRLTRAHQRQQNCRANPLREYCLFGSLLLKHLNQNNQTMNYTDETCTRLHDHPI